jgi:lipopolysaccharide transport system permease protein
VEPIIGVATLVVSVLYYWHKDGVWYVHVGPRIFVSLVCILLILVFTVSLSLVTSVLQARARDARFVLRYLLGFWVYFTPVIYPLSQVPASVRWLAYLNPLTAPIETFKWTLLPNMQHSWGWFGYSAAVTLVVAGFGIWFFQRAEDATVDSL